MNKDIIEATIKSTLKALFDDGLVDCNEYQGQAFDKLVKRVKWKLKE